MPHFSCRRRGVRSGGLLPLLAILWTALAVALLLPTASAVSCPDCINEDTRKFLKLVAGAFPKHDSSKLDGDYCTGVEWIRCSTNPHSLSVTFSDGGTLPELSSDIDPANVNVTHISGRYGRITGTLPTSWGQLTRLEEIDLASNSITGTLPAEWGQLGQLRIMYLDYNSIMGTLPKEWRKLEKLLYLDFFDNRLSGTLPKEWGELGPLYYLGFAQNTITGSLPSEWSQLRQLKQLYLQDNLITGTLPKEWSQLGQLKGLYLRNNSIAGTLPTEWRQLEKIEMLFLGKNFIAGTLPLEWDQLSQLSYLDLHENQLIGGLPDWSNFTVLGCVELRNNSLTGSLSASWAAFPKLYQVTLQGNNLCGCVPDAWAGNSVLQTTLDQMGANGVALRAADCATANKCGGMSCSSTSASSSSTPSPWSTDSISAPDRSSTSASGSSQCGGYKQLACGYVNCSAAANSAVCLASTMSEEANACSKFKCQNMRCGSNLAMVLDAAAKVCECHTVDAASGCPTRTLAAPPTCMLEATGGTASECGYHNCRSSPITSVFCYNALHGAGVDCTSSPCMGKKCASASSTMMYDGTTDTCLCYGSKVGECPYGPFGYARN